MPDRFALRLWPRSLFGRNLLLLLALTVLAQAFTVSVFMHVQRPRAAEVGHMVASQLNTIQATLASAPASERQASLERLDRIGRLRPAPAGPPAELDEPNPVSLVAEFLRALRSHLSPGIAFRWRAHPHPQAWVRLDVGGQPYWFTMPGSAVPHDNGLTLATLLVLSMVTLATLAAMLIQRRINRPLREIAAAAERIGRGRDTDRLPRYSASELAAVAEQFNAMADNLAAMESTRALMLAGISHDIRTPLTKLRLALALENRDDDALVEHIQRIDAIVGQFLDFGRSGADEPMAQLDLNTLIRQLAGEFESRGHVFALHLAELPPMHFRPIAMLRVLNNLMDNAVKYGGRGLEVHTLADAREVHVEILDRGPGMPADQVAHLLRPFTRADPGRAAVAGTGLGLAIVERLVRLHGGLLQLAPRPDGGLRARISLPWEPGPRTGATR